jgi:hypothetical protein
VNLTSIPFFGKIDPSLSRKLTASDSIGIAVIRLLPRRLVVDSAPISA